VIEPPAPEAGSVPEVGPADDRSDLAGGDHSLGSEHLGGVDAQRDLAERAGSADVAAEPRVPAQRNGHRGGARRHHGDELEPIVREPNLVAHGAGRPQVGRDVTGEDGPIRARLRNRPGPIPQEPMDRMPTVRPRHLHELAVPPAVTTIGEAAGPRRHEEAAPADRPVVRRRRADEQLAAIDRPRRDATAPVGVDRQPGVAGRELDHWPRFVHKSHKSL
jgi:hypothetical protein